MGVLRQFDALIIKDYVTDVFLFEPHGHTYYEMIYIFHGKGTHLLNHNKIIYGEGDLFLLSPGDHHHFEVAEPTRFVVIKFTEDYFSNHQQGVNGSQQELLPHSIMRMRAIKENKLQFNAVNSSALRFTIQNIISYTHRGDPANSAFIYLQLLSVFAMIKEELLHPAVLPESGPELKQALIAYIHQHIYEPQKCRIKAISHQFNLSPNYFGDYFKRNFGISYSEYIHQYRTTLIEKRIAGGQLNMKGIAREFGFSDESHFSNYFKKRRQLRPTRFICMP